MNACTHIGTFGITWCIWTAAGIKSKCHWTNAIVESATEFAFGDLGTTYQPVCISNIWNATEFCVWGFLGQGFKMKYSLIVALIKTAPRIIKSWYINIIFFRQNRTSHGVKDILVSIMQITTIITSNTHVHANRNCPVYDCRFVSSWSIPIVIMCPR